MKDLDLYKIYLNIEVDQDCIKQQIYLSQEHYIKKLLCTFGLDKAKPVSTPIDISTLPEIVPYSGQATPDAI